MTKVDFANEEEIKNASRILLPVDCCFLDDTEKEVIIKCNESRDIEACPGSGKTTTLLAKLLILANRMPLEGNKGICVLTHTNVGIDEIKEKLGSKADVLFRYPNHFGTIQSFVDKFLAIPFVKNKYGISLSRIDNEKYENEIKSQYYSLVFGDEEDGKLRNYLYGKGTPKDEFKSVATAQKNVNAINLFSNLFIPSGNDIKKGIDGKLFLKKDGSTQASKLKYKKLQQIKKEIINKGIICFDDAYMLATEYLKDSPDVSDAFINRFEYVFIDEMQDTAKHQIDILDKVFDYEKTIVQRFGDPNQSIYNEVCLEKIWKPRKSLKIRSSRRFGEKIGAVLKTVCIEDNKALRSSKDIDSLQPVMIVFENPVEVLPKFCELLFEKKAKYNGEELSVFEISNLDKRPIKAVGWIGKDDENRSIDRYNLQSYFWNYRKDLKKKEKVDYTSLKSFLKTQQNAKLKDYSDKIIDVLLHVLRLAEIKIIKESRNYSYTKTTFLKSLKEKGKLSNFQKRIANWSMRIHRSKSFDSSVIKEVKEYINADLATDFKFKITSDIKSFMNGKGEQKKLTKEAIEDNNTYTYSSNKELKVEVSNIHQVKGETHSATLYLETWYQGKFESESISNQLLRTPYKQPKRIKDTYTKETLKMAYVGMSRPRYLLCMAVHKDRFDEAFDIENGGLWEIVKTF